MVTRAAGLPITRASHGVRVLLADIEDLEPLAARRGVALLVDRAPALRTLSFDRAWMAQALANIVGNAIKVSPEGSAIEVRSGGGTGDVRIAVADRGPGLPDGAPLLGTFSPPSAGPRASPGFGLFVAKAIIDAHGGSLWLSPRRGAGAICFVSLPAPRPGR
jgi:two-component system OmpR family sensor kinase